MSRIVVETRWTKELKGMKNVRACPRCFAVYYEKHWHSWQTAGRAAKFLKEKIVEHMLCPECTQVVTGHHGATGWEGELRISGLAEAIKTDVLRTLRNVGTRAARMDPQDQIIKIDDRGAELRVLTTENRLAVRLGKKLDESFKGGKLKITYSKEDEPVRVVWTAPTPKKF